MIDWTIVYGFASTALGAGGLVYGMARNRHKDENASLESIKAEIKAVRLEARDATALEVRELRTDVVYMMNEVKDAVKELSRGFLENRERIIRAEALTEALNSLTRDRRSTDPSS